MQRKCSAIREKKKWGGWDITISIGDVCSPSKYCNDKYAHYHQKPIDHRDVNLTHSSLRGVNYLHSWKTSKSHRLLDTRKGCRNHCLARNHSSKCCCHKDRPKKTCCLFRNQGAQRRLVKTRTCQKQRTPDKWIEVNGFLHIGNSHLAQNHKIFLLQNLDVSKGTQPGPYMPREGRGKQHM